MKNLFGLMVGPIILAGIGFAFFGSFGPMVGLSVLLAAVVFVPLLGLGTAIVGQSLPMALLVANAIPFGHYLLNCLGRACPNYSFASAGPFYAAATFCGFVYWLIAGRNR